MKCQCLHFWYFIFFAVTAAKFHKLCSFRCTLQVLHNHVVYLICFVLEFFPHFLQRKKLLMFPGQNWIGRKNRQSFFLVIKMLIYMFNMFKDKRSYRFLQLRMVRISGLDIPIFSRILNSVSVYPVRGLAPGPDIR